MDPLDKFKLREVDSFVLNNDLLTYEERSQWIKDSVGISMNCSEYEENVKPLSELTYPAAGGYHLTSVKKGELGKLSKIQEELDEAVDAESQGVNIMVLLELSDMIGAVDAYLRRNFPGFTLSDLTAMAKVTDRAFMVGERE